MTDELMQSFFFFFFFFLALDIERWNLECLFNNTDHRTDLNGVDRLIVRRGQSFTISLYLRSGTYQPGLSSLDCVVETGATLFALLTNSCCFQIGLLVYKTFAINLKK